MNPPKPRRGKGEGGIPSGDKGQGEWEEISFDLLPLIFPLKNSG
jgi:hypothetical protein